MRRADSPFYQYQQRPSAQEAAAGALVPMPHVAQISSNIQFSISQPIGPIERLICELVGNGMGAVHQYVTKEACLNNRVELERLLHDPMVQRDSGGRINLRQLTAGVCWNDVPLQSARLQTREGIDTIAYTNSLSTISLSDAPYLRYTHPTFAATACVQDTSFALQPSRTMRYAMAGTYKHFPDSLIRACGVSPREIEQAKELLEYRTQLQNTHFHFMREDARDSSALVCKRAITQGYKWMREAVEKQDVFYVGNIWHMVEDSFSPAHCHRARPSVEGRMPWGAVVFVEWFGDQNDNSHGYLESYRATQSNNRPTKARVQLCAGPEGPLYSILRLFLVGVRDGREPDEVGRDCRRLLKRYVFNYRPDLSCDMDRFCHGHQGGGGAKVAPAAATEVEVEVEAAPASAPRLALMDRPEPAGFQRAARPLPVPYIEEIDAQILHRIDRSLLDYVVRPRLSKMEPLAPQIFK